MKSAPPEPSLRPYFMRSDYLQGDAARGTIHNASGQRLLLLPQELIQGLHRAVRYETGHAWQIVAYTCGLKWGERMVQTWASEWRAHHQVEMERVDYVFFQAWLEAAFEFYGWGDLEVDFSDEHDGMITFWLGDSVLASLLGEIEDFEETHACEIFAGLFASLASHLAGRQLGAMEVACAISGHDRCRFAIMLPEFIERGRAARMRGANPEEILDVLLG